MTLEQRLREAPFTLAMSSGFFGFFAHYGLTKALLEKGLKPQRVTGSSAGAILAASWAFDLPEHEIKSVLIELKRSHFWDPALGFGLLKGERLEAMMREILRGHQQVLPISISTFEILGRKTKSFEAGDTAKFVRASCAVPVMFHPVKIEGRLYWDGGVLDKLALDSVKPGEKVLVHALPSQGAHQIVEGRRDLAEIRRNYFVISPQSLPAVGPFALEKGPEAIENAYQYAIKALNSDYSL
jgi:NTE family protein